MRSPLAIAARLNHLPLTSPRRHLPLMLRFAAVLLVALPALLPAQGLRLGDVFTSGTVTQRTPAPPPAATPAPAVSAPPVSAPLTLSELNPARAAELLRSLDADVQARRSQDVLRKTDLLLAWYAKESADYGEALWFRTQALEQAGDSERLVQATRAYLQLQPKGPRRGWFLQSMAREAARQNKPAEAITVWRAILSEKHPVASAEALDAAALIVSAGDAVLARQLLAASGATGPRHDRILLETLLVEDDPAVPVPTAIGGDARARLSLALLYEVRGQQAEAARILSDLRRDPADLSAAERTLVGERLDAQAARPWPAR